MTFYTNLLQLYHALSIKPYLYTAIYRRKVMMEVVLLLTSSDHSVYVFQEVFSIQGPVANRALDSPPRVVRIYTR